MATAKVEILRADGSREEHQVGRRILMDWIRRMIRCDTLDVVNLRDGRVMLVDDEGHIRSPKPPVNEAATDLYWSICRPGTTHTIVGDVAVALDADFA